MFIDLHSHILPGLDDGAKSFAAAKEIAETAYRSGTTVIAATPHYNHPLQCLPGNSKKNIIETYKELKKYFSENSVPIKLFLGAELLARDNISQLYRNNEIITINSSRYVLTEFVFDESPFVMHKRTDELISLGLIPLIAHPERYSFLPKSSDDIYRLINKGCKFQINKDSPLGKYGEAAKKSSLWLLKNDFVSLIASDAHSVGYRNADMSEIYNWLVSEFSLSRIEKLMHDNAKRILLDMNI